MAMFIDNDSELWKAADYKKTFNVNDRADFYDKYLVEKVWPNTFAKTYNKEIDDMQETSFQQLTKDQINPDRS